MESRFLLPKALSGLVVFGGCIRCRYALAHQTRPHTYMYLYTECRKDYHEQEQRGHEIVHLLSDVKLNIVSSAIKRQK
eukprot:720214-Pleurochrysis_carterae.AAC.4